MARLSPKEGPPTFARMLIGRIGIFPHYVPTILAHFTTNVYDSSRVGVSKRHLSHQAVHKIPEPFV